MLPSNRKGRKSDIAEEMELIRTISIRRIWAVSAYEFTWDLKKIKLFAVILLAVGITVAVGYAVPLIIGKQNLGIATNMWWLGTLEGLINEFLTGVFVLIIAGIIASDSIAWEFDKGTITPLLSQPVTRTEVYLGKFLEKFLITLGIAIIVSVLAVFSAYLAVGTQSYLDWLPVAILVFTLNLLFIVSMAFFVGAVVKSSGLTFGILFGAFLAFEIGMIAIVLKYGFSLKMLFIPFFSIGFIISNIPNYILDPNGSVTFGIGMFSKVSHFTEATSTILLYAISGLILDLVIFFIAGYLIFKYSEVKG